MVLLAPEYKAIDVYMLNLIITCVMLCPEEFGNCIFKGEKIAHVSKEMILTKMYRNFSKSDMNKLNNTLDKYNLYLQKKSIDFVNNDYEENMVLLAPEYKAIDVYMLNLIITCVMLCPEEFGNCIFKGEKITHVSKEMILTKMYRNFSKSDMNKLNNTLDKYIYIG
ncbi:hypothetical protein TSAR_002297 [Trichomalopsis sarcophagae]|uniref:Uncharacterized protein n=1 Tax=Trichomalopsis sarcophagae TaxID=543379 RepID=A0A232EG14_9HYME|nr:hypothetical protein TSAR_002297 [Trichomalopsis sarcophagae]